MMIYGGAVLNMLDPSLEPPIKKPCVIVEFKELRDWYARTRDLKGYFRRKFTAEEWRSRWLNGLYDGLADILGVVKKKEYNVVKEETGGLRIREYQLVQLYKNFYNPKEMILVSRCRVPGDVKRYMEENGIEVFDNIGFSREKLKEIAEIIVQYSRHMGKKHFIELDDEVYRLAENLSTRLGLSIGELVAEALKTLASQS